VALDFLNRSRDVSDGPSGSRAPLPAAAAHSGGHRRGPWIAALVLLGAIAAAFAVSALALSKASVSGDSSALAHISLPTTGGTIERVSVTGPSGKPIPVTVRDDRIWPRRLLAPGEQVSVDVTVRRPGWIGWLAGSSEQVHATLRTPSAAVATRFVTLKRGEPLQVSFDQPVRVLAYGQPGTLHRRVLTQALTTVTIAQHASAGTLQAAGAPRTWESLPAPAVVSWFPAGVRATAVVSPRPGARITPTTPIYLTFSQPVSAALGQSLPALSPWTAGRWAPVDAHTLVFRPRSYGFALGATERLVLPSTVRLVGAAGITRSAEWKVPLGSTLRLQEILAALHYLPLHVSTATTVAHTASAQVAAAVNPPPAHFTWRYGSTPSSLRGLWQPGADNVVTRGALMAFENDHSLTTDGVAGPAVWRVLIHAIDAGQQGSFGYTYVSVSESSQNLSVWHNGRVRVTTPVNTGIASAPTATGVYPVYEHISSGTMSGTNPDGSHYSDPGVPWISYFNGGDALHGFTRAQYGFPQSLGCVEMPVGTAGQVWPYTPVGTLVNVE
jgi:peptidoglycan hydrolase-like protein with peptidoglycan-binding domain